MFDRSPMNISPALVGVFGGDLRVTGNYRKQWSTMPLPVDYKTFTATVEHKLNTPKITRGYFAGGLHFNYDDAGDLSLAQSQIGLSGSYTMALTNKEDKVNKHFLSGGLQAAFSQRNFNTENLRVDLQFEGDAFDPRLPSQEDQFNDRAAYANFSGGLNYRYQNLGGAQDKRTRIDLGLAIYHFNEPNKSFNKRAKESLYSRYSVYGISSFKLTQKADIGFLASAQFQGAHQEFVVGGNTRKFINDQVALLLGLSYRMSDIDALIPNLMLDYRNFSFGFSFDLNFSQLDNASNGSVASELSAIYTVGKTKPKPTKNCLIF